MSPYTVTIVVTCWYHRLFLLSMLLFLLVIMIFIVGLCYSIVFSIILHLSFGFHRSAPRAFLSFVNMSLCHSVTLPFKSRSCSHSFCHSFYLFHGIFVLYSLCFHSLLTCHVIHYSFHIDTSSLVHICIYIHTVAYLSHTSLCHTSFCCCSYHLYFFSHLIHSFSFIFDHDPVTRSVVHRTRTCMLPLVFLPSIYPLTQLSSCVFVFLNQ